MKKLFFGWLLVSLSIACNKNHEPTLQEIVIGVYDTGDWVMVDTLTGTGGGRGCTTPYLVIRESQQGLLDIEAICRVGIDITDKRNINGLGVRDSPQKTSWWIPNADIFYELYQPSTNSTAGFFFQYPNESDFRVALRTKTTKGDSIKVAGTKRKE